MSDAKLETNCFVTLLGGGSAPDLDISAALQRAPRLIAADGGANRAVDHGVLPDLVIGDMDSITEETKAKLTDSVLTYVAEQDSTDFEKCLTRVQAPLIIAVGFTGKRLDHQLAVCTGLVRFAHQRCIVLGESDVIFACPPELSLSLPIGTRVSLFPMQPVQGASRGLKWPIDGLTLDPAGQIGTSNQSTQPVIEVRPRSDGLLVIVPRAHLDAVIKALVPDG